MSNLRKRLKDNFAANIFSQGVNIAYQILTIPLFLTFWSKEELGDWLILSSLPTFVSLSKMGLGKVAGNSMTISLGADKREEAKGSLHTTWSFQLFMNVVLLVGIIFFLAFFSVKDLFALETISTRDANLAFLILTMNSLFSMQVNLITNIYRAVGQTARGTFLGSGLRLISVAVMAIAFLSGFSSVVEISLFLTGVYYLGGIFYYFDCRRLAPDLKPGIKCFSKERLRKDLTHGMAFMALPFGRMLTNQAVLIIVKIYLGAGAVVVYSTLTSLVNILFQFAAIINRSISPELSRLYGAGDFERLQKLFSKSMALILCITLIVATILMFWGQDILLYWTRNEVKVSPGMIMLFLVPIIINSFWRLSLTVLNSTLKHRKSSLLFLIASSLVPIITLLLLSFTDLKISAIPIGFICMHLFMAFQAIPAASKVLKG